MFTFPVGMTTPQCISILAVDDMFTEDIESFSLEITILSSNATANARQPTIINIIDNNSKNYYYNYIIINLNGLNPFLVSNCHLEYNYYGFYLLIDSTIYMWSIIMYMYLSLHCSNMVYVHVVLFSAALIAVFGYFLHNYNLILLLLIVFFSLFSDVDIGLTVSELSIDENAGFVTVCSMLNMGQLCADAMLNVTADNTTDSCKSQ